MGAPHYTVALQKIAAEQGLTVLHAAADYDARAISTADVNRPGLQLAGFYNYFDPERLQIIGRVESTYLETLTPDQRRERFEQFMRYNIIGLVICHAWIRFPSVWRWPKSTTATSFSCARTPRNSWPTSSPRSRAISPRV